MYHPIVIGHHPRSKTKRNLHQVAHWLPSHEHISHFITSTKHTAQANRARHEHHAAHRKVEPLPPTVTASLAHLLEHNPIVRMHFEEMIKQDALAPKEGSPQPHPKYDSVQQLLDCIDIAAATAPEYSESGLVGFPINALLYYCMATPAGFAAFRDPLVNAEFKKILNAYSAFLETDASLIHLITAEPNGWFSKAGLAKLKLEEIKHDPNHVHKGFKSWNHFFIREFVDGARPPHSPDDKKVIVSACESYPFSLQTDVKRTDSFWLKGQPYSLLEMLANDSLADQFVGGTVYQAFLSALLYHRWHSPVDGTIVKNPRVIEGTYYSEAESMGLDEVGPDLSQGYLSAVAARGVLFIEADDPVIGLIAFVSIGMAEVSSNYFHDKIKAGYKVKKGEEMGHFRYGGSTHCLIFRKGAIKEWHVDPKDPSSHEKVVQLSTKLATAN